MCTVRLALHPRIASDNRAPELLCRARQPGPVVSSHASCLALQAMEVDGARGGQPEVEALGRALAPGAKYMVNRLEDRVSTAPAWHHRLSGCFLPPGPLAFSCVAWSQ